MSQTEMSISYNLKWKCEPARHCVQFNVKDHRKRSARPAVYMSHQNARAKLRHKDKTASVKSKATKKKLPASEEADLTPCMSILWQTIQYRGKRKKLMMIGCKTWAHDMKHARKSTVSYVGDDDFICETCVTYKLLTAGTNRPLFQLRHKR